MSAAWPETSLARVVVAAIAKAFEELSAVAATVKGARLASGRRAAGGPPGAGLAALGAGPTPGGRGEHPGGDRLPQDPVWGRPPHQRPRPHRCRPPLRAGPASGTPRSIVILAKVQVKGAKLRLVLL